MSRGVPAGTEVGLYVDLVATVAVGDVIELRSGRRYGVLTVRVQERGKHTGRQHLRAIVLDDEDTALRYEWIGSICKIASPLAPNTLEQYPLGSWEPCVLCDSPAEKACRATVRRRRTKPNTHRIRWYARRGGGSKGTKRLA